MVIENRFSIGDFVYLKTDPYQYKRIITAITIRQTTLIYEVSFSETTSWHTDAEMSFEADINLTFNN